MSREASKVALPLLRNTDLVPLWRDAKHFARGLVPLSDCDWLAQPVAPAVHTQVRLLQGVERVQADPEREDGELFGRWEAAAAALSLKPLVTVILLAGCWGFWSILRCF